MDIGLFGNCKEEWLPQGERMPKPKRRILFFYPNVVFNVLTECVSSKSGCYLAAHQLSNHVGLAFMLTQVKHSDDVGMGAAAP